MSAIPKGEPSILFPPNFKNINISGLKTNIDRSQFQFTDKTSYRWWIKFITEIEQMANSAEKVEKYAKRQAFWLLPYLVNKTTRYVDEEEELNPSLAEALDRELDDHRVSKYVHKSNFAKIW